MGRPIIASSTFSLDDAQNAAAPSSPPLKRNRSAARSSSALSSDMPDVDTPPRSPSAIRLAQADPMYSPVAGSPDPMATDGAAVSIEDVSWEPVPANGDDFDLVGQLEREFLANSPKRSPMK